MEFYIFRHGETLESSKGIHYSAENVKTADILPGSRAVIKGLAEYLKSVPTDFNTSSPLIRCVNTTKIINEVTGKVFVYDERLTEFTFQLGETFEQMAERTKNFLEELKTKNYKSIAICTHGAGISALKHLITKGEYTLEDLQDYPKPGVLLIIRDKEVEYLNFREDANTSKD